jgi:hypothetical protein
MVKNDTWEYMADIVQDAIKLTADMLGIKYSFIPDVKKTYVNAILMGDKNTLDKFDYVRKAIMGIDSARSPIWNNIEEFIKKKIKEYERAWY